MKHSASMMKQMREDLLRIVHGNLNKYTSVLFCGSGTVVMDVCNELLEISSEDVLLFSMPVYGGFIPQSCAKMAKNLKGNNTPVIIAAVYGNRH